MGAGKTAFAQGFGRALGVDEPITSPTFALVQSYDIVGDGVQNKRGVQVLHHADLYRLDRTAEVADLALRELVEFGGVLLVEWGDVVESFFDDRLVIHLQPDDGQPDDGQQADDRASGGHDELDGSVRLIDVSGVGSSWASRWGRIAEGLEQFRC
jgi:tRNA threonylcarbamoyladenosine biosynthesis protein TsaE